MIEGVVGFLRGLLKLNQAVESLLVDLVAAWLPWLAPVPVAIMVYRNMVGRMGFPAWAAAVSALCTEGLGLAAVFTAVTFLTWNTDERTKFSPKAPFIGAVIVGAVYLATVMTMNGILESGDTNSQIARGLISTLTITAGCILGMRGNHSRRVMDAERLRKERKEERQESRKLPKVAGKFPESEIAPERNSGIIPAIPETTGNLFRNIPAKTRWGDLLPEDYRKIKNSTTKEVMQDYGVEDRLARLWRERVRDYDTGE